MVKARRNRQPKDWQKMTNVRSVSGILRSNAENKPLKLTAESQLKKVSKNSRRLRSQIERLKHERDTSTTTPGRKQWCEGAILTLEKRLTKLIIRLMTLSGQSEHGALLLQKQKDDRSKALAIAKKNSEKIRHGIVKYPKDNTGFHPSQGGKGKIKEFIEVNAGKRKVKRKYISEVKSESIRGTSETVKVKNPNIKKGIIYLPRKRENEDDQG